MVSDDKLKPNGKTGKRLTILSIDGGGVRGIIPAKILEVLEGYLEELELELDKKMNIKEESNETRHDLWEYFDMIAGTSSGGLITAMITTRDVDNPQLPTCNASEVVEFFATDAVKIFPKTITDRCCLRWLLEGIASVFGSIYEAGPLEKLLRDKFGEALLSRALTSVIIPAFDTDDEVPVFFSNLKGVNQANPLYNVLVKDACRATTAVPILFPAASFNEVSDDQNKSGRQIKEFNVIDGGIAVNDPTLVAVTQAIAEERSRDCMDFSDVLVLSLGTGEHPIRFLAKPHWSSVQWLLNPKGSPLLDSFLSASEDMVEYYTSMIFDAHKFGHRYLRIQTELPECEFLRIDDAGKQNLNRLEDATAELVRFHEVSRRNFAPRKPATMTDYGRALYSFARLLVEERRKLAKTKDHSGKGKSKLQGRSPRDEKKGPDETLRDGRAPSTAGAVQRAVCGCCLMMGEILLVLVVLAALLLRVILRVICDVAGF